MPLRQKYICWLRSEFHLIQSNCKHLLLSIFTAAVHNFTTKHFTQGFKIYSLFPLAPRQLFWLTTHGAGPNL